MYTFLNITVAVHATLNLGGFSGLLHNQEHRVDDVGNGFIVRFADNDR